MTAARYRKQDNFRFKPMTQTLIPPEHNPTVSWQYLAAKEAQLLIPLAACSLSLTTKDGELFRPTLILAQLAGARLLTVFRARRDKLQLQMLPEGTSYQAAMAQQSSSLLNRLGFEADKHTVDTTGPTDPLISEVLQSPLHLAKAVKQWQDHQVASERLLLDATRVQWMQAHLQACRTIVATTPRTPNETSEVYWELRSALSRDAIPTNGMRSEEVLVLSDLLGHILESLPEGKREFGALLQGGVKAIRPLARHDSAREAAQQLRTLDGQRKLAELLGEQLKPLRGLETKQRAVDSYLYQKSLDPEAANGALLPLRLPLVHILLHLLPAPTLEGVLAWCGLEP